MALFKCPTQNSCEYIAKPSTKMIELVLRVPLDWCFLKTFFPECLFSSKFVGFFFYLAKFYLNQADKGNFVWLKP